MLLTQAMASAMGPIIALAFALTQGGAGVSVGVVAMYIEGEVGAGVGQAARINKKLCRAL